MCVCTIRVVLDSVHVRVVALTFSDGTGALENVPLMDQGSMDSLVINVQSAGLLITHHRGRSTPGQGDARLRM